MLEEMVAVEENKTWELVSVMNLVHERGDIMDLGPV
jgi:hypothetical protein